MKMLKSNEILVLKNKQVVVQHGNTIYLLEPVARLNKKTLTKDLKRVMKKCYIMHLIDPSKE